MMSIQPPASDGNHSDAITLSLHEAIDRHTPAIVATLAADGIAVIDGALPAPARQALYNDARSVTLKPAAIGRGQAMQRDESIRSDSIAWLDGASSSQQAWLDAMEQLRCAINRQLFLGLFDYECHYAHYQPGQFYRRHRDSFAGNRVAHARVLSTVCYLNEHWQAPDAGELAVCDSDERQILRIAPTPGTLVIFLSEQFPHEVLPTNTSRYSIAGWFRRS